MPPLTPRTTRRPSRGMAEGLLPDLAVAQGADGAELALRLVRQGEGGGVGVLGQAGVGDLVRRHLLEGDGEGLAGAGGDLRGHERAEALTELVVVGVHLA